MIHHSDHGTQYTSEAFQTLCLQHNIVQSMGSVGDCYDNAQMESWFATLKRECIPRLGDVDREGMHRGVVRWIETWYNRVRLHSELCGMSPRAFEERLLRKA